MFCSINFRISYSYPVSLPMNLFLDTDSLPGPLSFKTGFNSNNFYCLLSLSIDSFQDICRRDPLLLYSTYPGHTIIEGALTECRLANPCQFRPPCLSFLSLSFSLERPPAAARTTPLPARPGAIPCFPVQTGSRRNPSPWEWTLPDSRPSRIISRCTFPFPSWSYERAT